MQFNNGFPLPTHIGGGTYGYAPQQPPVPDSTGAPTGFANSAIATNLNALPIADVPNCGFSCPCCMTANQCTAAGECKLCQGNPFLQRFTQFMSQCCSQGGCTQMPDWFRQGFQANQQALQQYMAAMGLCNTCPRCPPGGCCAQNMNRATECCKSNLGADRQTGPWGGPMQAWLAQFREICKHMTPEMALQVMNTLIRTGKPV